MSEMRRRYPDFGHFMATELYQDADAIDDDLRHVVDGYVHQYKREAGYRVLDDLNRLLENHHNDIDIAFKGFDPQVYPPGYGMTTAEWLAEIARLFAVRLNSQP